jgi:hypothetical protein
MLFLFLKAVLMNSCCVLVSGSVVGLIPLMLTLLVMWTFGKVGHTYRVIVHQVAFVDPGLIKVSWVANVGFLIVEFAQRFLEVGVVSHDDEMGD